LTDHFGCLDAAWEHRPLSPRSAIMASFETIASGIAQDATYLDALTVPAGLE